MQKSQSTLKSGILSTLILVAIFGSVYQSKNTQARDIPEEIAIKTDTATSELRLFLLEI